ncbi:hypothetical protein As57867_007269, partial [Aphanomyces stellatus]
MERPVWFALVDGQGKAYNGTTATKVKIKSSSDIDDFKNAVKAANPNKLATFDASELNVYANLDEFHKAGPAPPRTSLDEDYAITSLEEDAMIGDYGRSMKDALLVVVPSHASVVIPEIEQSTVTKGPVIELTSAGILEFLESQMNDITKFNALRHFLPEKDRKIKLSGRDVALQRAAECMKNLSKPVYQTSKPDRSIPVCCGLPGLGKSRMLDEWQKIFELADIKGPQLGAFVIYYNGHKPQPIEASMTIEASFSWRLLHRLFLEGNGPEFGKWFSENLPKNCGKLQLQITLEVVRDKAIQMGISTPEDTLQMFLGIDEYQSIKDVNGIRVTTNQDGTKQELLQDLIDVLGHVLSSPVNAIRIFPMFAGTDLSVISIANSSKTECFRLPMLLLTPREVESAVSSIVNGPL